MVKNQTIIIRVEKDVKRRIEAAAARQGKSVTTFLLEAAETAVRKVEAMTTVQKPRGKGACPTYFVASCYEAQQGGTGGWANAGFALAIHLASEKPYELEDEAWQQTLDQFAHLLERKFQAMGALDMSYFRSSTALDDDDRHVLGWLQEYFPRCLALVPARRRRSFLAGFYQAYADDRVQLEF
jgi:hypothetical protein